MASPRLDADEWRAERAAYTKARNRQRLDFARKLAGVIEQGPDVPETWRAVANLIAVHFELLTGTQSPLATLDMLRKSVDQIVKLELLKGRSSSGEATEQFRQLMRDLVEDR